MLQGLYFVLIVIVLDIIRSRRKSDNVTPTDNFVVQVLSRICFSADSQSEPVSAVCASFTLRVTTVTSNLRLDYVLLNT